MTLNGRWKITFGAWRWNNAHGGMRFASPPYGLPHFQGGGVAQRVAQEVGGLFTAIGKKNAQIVKIVVFFLKIYRKKEIETWMMKNTIGV
jgi:hypothetical protein